MLFKIDENLPIEVVQLLSKAGHDAISVIAQPLGGRPDANIAAVCMEESRILMTPDTDFANILAYPPQKYAGIIVIRTDGQSKATMLGYLPRLMVAAESPHHHVKRLPVCGAGCTIPA